MKTELHPRPHRAIAGATIVEIWHNGQLIGTVTGCDHQPGVRVLSKFPVTVHHEDPVTQATERIAIRVGVTEIHLHVPNN